MVPVPATLQPADETYFERWIELLSISTRFDFQRVRQLAIDMIDASQTPLDPIKKIYLAERHAIPQWFFPAFEALCQRVHLFDVTEAKVIGIEYSTLVAGAATSEIQV